MTGAALHAYVVRRLAENDVTVHADRADELYDYITEGRDELVQAFVLAAPVVVRSAVTLEEDGSDDRVWSFPAATADPLRIISVHPVNYPGRRLQPAANLNEDNGEYVWDSVRDLRLADGIEPTGGVQVHAVLQGADIDVDTAEADIGLPTPCHRAIGKYAVVLALTANEKSDARGAMGLYSRELDKLERIYGEFDEAGGAALREVLLAGLADSVGENIY